MHTYNTLLFLSASCGSYAVGAGPLAVPPLSSIGFYYGIASGNLFDTTETTESTQQLQGDDFESVGLQVERWANQLLSETDDSWTQVHCSKVVRKKFNPQGQTQQFLKWMRDSREDATDSNIHPCMKLTSTIDAPLEVVCLYLSQQNRSREYNSLLVRQRVVQVLTPHSQICWGQSPQLLFIKPRDFLTYCHHRWRRDGTQVVVNQACEHAEFNNQNGILWAYSLRGANFLSRHPNDPENMTRITMLSHANVGSDLPHWAVKTAVNILAPIKPFEIMHRIRVGVERSRPELEQQLRKKKHIDGRSNQPAGIAQMVYGCYWPDGGGLVEEQD